MPLKKMSLLGGGTDIKMSHFYKLCLKSNSSHSELFWKKNLGEKGATPILSHFSPILAISKIFTSVLTFLGEQKFFLQKCPKSGLVSQKNYFEFFVTLGGGSNPM